MVSAVTVTLAVLFGILQVSLASYVYLDAPEWDLDGRKWALITLFVPFFGIFAYLFERDERRPNPDEERRDAMFVDGAFKVHKSRADDAPWISDAQADAAASSAAVTDDETAEAAAETSNDDSPDDERVEDPTQSE